MNIFGGAHLFPRDAIEARATNARALSMSCALSAAGLASRFHRSVSLRTRTSARPASVLSRRSRTRTPGSRGCANRAADGDMSSFLDEADFDAMREAMSLFDEQRDTVIKRSRDITKASKVAIPLDVGRRSTVAGTKLHQAQPLFIQMNPVDGSADTWKPGRGGAGKNS